MDDGKEDDWMEDFMEEDTEAKSQRLGRELRDLDEDDEEFRQEAWTQNQTDAALFAYPVIMERTETVQITSHYRTGQIMPYGMTTEEVIHRLTNPVPVTDDLREFAGLYHGRLFPQSEVSVKTVSGLK